MMPNFREYNLTGVLEFEKKYPNIWQQELELQKQINNKSDSASDSSSDSNSFTRLLTKKEHALLNLWSPQNVANIKDFCLGKSNLTNH